MRVKTVAQPKGLIDEVDAERVKTVLYSPQSLGTPVKLGDSIIQLPAVEALAKRFPKAEVLVVSGAPEVFDGIRGVSVINSGKALDAWTAVSDMCTNGDGVLFVGDPSIIREHFFRFLGEGNTALTLLDHAASLYAGKNAKTHKHESPLSKFYSHDRPVPVAVFRKLALAEAGIPVEGEPRIRVSQAESAGAERTLRELGFGPRGKRLRVFFNLFAETDEYGMLAPSNASSLLSIAAEGDAGVS